MTILVTGAAGFIGFHLSTALAKAGHQVIGVDSLNEYYDVNLKLNRLHELKQYPNFTFIKLNIADKNGMEQLFDAHRFKTVINLAAQAGVRYSLENPYAYVESNLVGFGNILENCRQHDINHLLFASSSSVYGANSTQPFSETHTVDHPISLYAASKKSNEAMAHSYAALFHLPCTGLRFFTVFGPWGRPDMALFRFTKHILEGKPLPIFNRGEMIRDFTYVGDVVSAIIAMIPKPAQPDASWTENNPQSSFAPYRIYNIGNSHPIKLMDFITALEETLGKQAIKDLLPMQPGDVAATHADTTLLQQTFGWTAQTSVKEGIENFVSWYQDYYHVGRAT